MKVFRTIFLGFMTWLLVAFLPGHTRGLITMNSTGDGDACCAPVVKKIDCCATDDASATHAKKPSASDKANCAVCAWAAGLLTIPPVSFDHSLAERAYEIARVYDAQVRRAAIRLNHHGRDPPADALA